MSSWRNKARTVISTVIRDNPNLSLEELKKKISDAYPFGMRAYHPYQIWLDEVKDQLGTKKHKPTTIEDPNQTSLF